MLMPLTISEGQLRKPEGAAVGDSVWARIDLSDSSWKFVQRVWWVRDWSHEEERVEVFGLGVVRGLMTIVVLR